jgi:hypothetical protein
MNVRIEWAVNPPLFYILEDPISNLGPDADYPSWASLTFSLAYPCKCPEMPQIGPRLFPSTSVPIRHPLTVLSSDAVRCEILGRCLAGPCTSDKTTGNNNNNITENGIDTVTVHTLAFWLYRPSVWTPKQDDIFPYYSIWYQWCNLRSYSAIVGSTPPSMAGKQHTHSHNCGLAC